MPNKLFYKKKPVSNRFKPVYGLKLVFQGFLPVFRFNRDFLGGNIARNERCVDLRVLRVKTPYIYLSSGVIVIWVPNPMLMLIPVEILEYPFLGVKKWSFFDVNFFILDRSNMS